MSEGADGLLLRQEGDDGRGRGADGNPLTHGDQVGIGEEQYVSLCRRHFRAALQTTTARARPCASSSLRWGACLQPPAALAKIREPHRRRDGDADQGARGASPARRSAPGLWRASSRPAPGARVSASGLGAGPPVLLIACGFAPNAENVMKDATAAQGP